MQTCSIFLAGSVVTNLLLLQCFPHQFARVENDQRQLSRRRNNERRNMRRKKTMQVRWNRCLSLPESRSSDCLCTLYMSQSINQRGYPNFSGSCLPCTTFPTDLSSLHGRMPRRPSNSHSNSQQVETSLSGLIMLSDAPSFLWAFRSFASHLLPFPTTSSHSPLDAGYKTSKAIPSRRHQQRRSTPPRPC